MAYSPADYLTQTNELLASGRELLQRLEQSAGTMGREVSALEQAAKPAAVTGLGFAATQRESQGAALEAEDELRAILFECQAANALIGAGLATEAPERASAHLSMALDQIEQVQANAIAPAVSFQFEAGSSVKSADLTAAKETFRSDAEFSLDRLTTQATEVVQSVIDEIQKLDPSKVSEAIEKLGKALPSTAEAARLLKKGIERLKNAIDSLLKLLGADALAEVKTRVAEFLQKIENGEYTRQILTSTFGLPETRSRIEAMLKHEALAVVSLDEASNQLRPLAEGYDRQIGIIKGILAAIVLATAAMAFLQIATPWLPLVLGGAYIVLVGATVLIGMDYAGVRGPVQWVRGVREIADTIAPSSAANI